MLTTPLADQGFWMLLFQSHSKEYYQEHFMSVQLQAVSVVRFSTKNEKPWTFWFVATIENPITNSTVPSIIFPFCEHRFIDFHHYILALSLTFRKLNLILCRLGSFGDHRLQAARGRWHMRRWLTQVYSLLTDYWWWMNRWSQPPHPSRFCFIKSTLTQLKHNQKRVT